MSKKKKKKTPRTSFNPVESKIPKAGIFPSEDNHPEFRVEQMDKDGLWGWDKFEPSMIQELFKKIFEAQKLTWQSLRDNGSHPILYDKLSAEAQKRLRQLQKDDLDELYSLRISGSKRIWGIKEGNLFLILWWDPKHEVCPSLKKHT
ncbi:MAG: hypothetical protein COT84_07530 [Chlamydiae bacterium CG10_big_fil_rev_8_21_14_0_10_35_9]|nr:MAG: hypothetical protein COT84_07530 [Chlamydiae bacterium CG10_big_fil_rev_8_21_14_0_10_35_9]